ILVSDAFEAMTSDRVYRKAIGVTQAIAELRAGAGRQFDPGVVEAMVPLVEAGVFTQLMEQYGRIVEPWHVEAPGAALEAAREAEPSAPLPPAAHGDAMDWARQQLAANEQAHDQAA
ncbi:MAG: putative metal dependent phosphohydrolase, partial [Thermoleophilia bacterium]|nr:putative metal dependent phosphohydrolase [Thermoleophilia bacterium]